MLDYDKSFQKLENVKSHLTEHKKLILETYISSNIKHLENLEKFEASLINLDVLIDIFKTHKHTFGFDVLTERIGFLFADDGLIYEMDTVFNNNPPENYVYTNLMNLIRKLSDYHYKYDLIQSSRSTRNYVKEVLDNYIDIGKELSKDPLMVNMRRKLGKLKIRDLPSQFAAIIGPSYMGKTQSAFTLSHMMNVIYVNFSSIISNSSHDQKIYKALESVALLFYLAIKFDIDAIRYDELENHGAKKFADFINIPLKTVGLLFTLLRSRMLMFSPDSTGVNDWFKTMALLDTVLIPKMTIIDFETAIRGLKMNLKKTLMFIDEFVLTNFKQDLRLKFLRNLCRYLNIPVVVSSTNSKATNLIAQEDSISSGENLQCKVPWVKVFTRLPSLSPKALALAVNFKAGRSKYQNQELRKFLSSDSKSIDYESLASTIFGSTENSRDSRETFVKFLKFIVPWCLKTLPGIGRYSFAHFLGKVAANIQEPLSGKGLWELFISAVVDSIDMRKRNFSDNFEAMLACAHSLTFPCKLRRHNEFGGTCAKKVNCHFFKYGRSNEKMFILFLNPGSKQQSSSEGSDTNDFIGNLEYPMRQSRPTPNTATLKRDKETVEYEEGCWFPSFDEDILLNVASWNYLLKHNCPYTLADMYVKFIESAKNFTFGPAEATIQDAFAFEVLAAWSICSATHRKIVGGTSGLEVFILFIKNIECFHDYVTNLGQSYVFKFNFSAFKTPNSLTNFLKDKISFPYLICNENLTDNFVQNFAPYCQFGKSFLCRANYKRDVIFDVNRICDKGKISKTQGFIECKYHKEPVGLPLFYDYYKRACEENCPISILMCRKIQTGLKHIASTSRRNENFEPLKKSARISKGQQQRPGATQPSTETEWNEKLLDLWQSDESKINIYAIYYETTTNDQSKTVSGEFILVPLKEFDNPTGVFILVESNFEIPARNLYTN